MEFSICKNIFVILLMASIFMGGVSFVLGNSNGFFPKSAAPASVAQNNIDEAAPAEPGIPEPPPPPPPPQKLSNPPEIIKAVYLTGWSAGTKKYLDYLSNLFRITEINAVVIDIKGSGGYVNYASGAEEVKKYDLNYNVISDIDYLIRFLHDQNIYAIGRISVFEDPVYSKARPELAVYNKAKTMDLASPVLWTDNNGLSWLDPASKDAWNYNVSLAKDAFLHGFDEINFDYIRFPSDGDMKNIGFPVYDGKTPAHKIMREFFQYLRQQLAGEKISADLFGLTTINKDDLGVGQVLEDALENFDFVCPMVYPSHYAVGFMGYANPAEHPYEVVKYSMDNALAREKIVLLTQKLNDEVAGSPASESIALLAGPLAKFRPWLQDFNMGAVYTADLVKGEIKATQDSLGADFAGFMLWNPSNIYTQGAILK